ncbi:hypothetical protein DFS34DRAFT_377491 [Phlyctochytrium arcticum]|nr:hypothetical protein DFS34DRAFT_377491 [Phlyctochytrium arcticum]
MTAEWTSHTPPSSSLGQPYLQQQQQQQQQQQSQHQPYHTQYAYQPNDYQKLQQSFSDHHPALQAHPSFAIPGHDNFLSMASYATLESPTATPPPAAGTDLKDLLKQPGPFQPKSLPRPTPPQTLPLQQSNSSMSAAVSAITPLSPSAAGSPTSSASSAGMPVMAGHISPATTITATPPLPSTSASTTPTPAQAPSGPVRQVSAARRDRHGAELASFQKERFPQSSRDNRYPAFLEQLLQMFEKAKDKVGDGQDVQFSRDALRDARSRVAASSSSRGWRIWLKEPLFNRFRDVKQACTPPDTTHAEFVELLLDLYYLVHEDEEKWQQVRESLLQPRSGNSLGRGLNDHGSQFGFDPSAGASAITANAIALQNSAAAVAAVRSMMSAQQLQGLGQATAALLDPGGSMQQQSSYYIGTNGQLQDMSTSSQATASLLNLPVLNGGWPSSVTTAGTASHILATASDFGHLSGTNSSMSTAPQAALSGQTLEAAAAAGMAAGATPTALPGRPVRRSLSSPGVNRTRTMLRTQPLPVHSDYPPVSMNLNRSKTLGAGHRRRRDDGSPGSTAPGLQRRASLRGSGAAGDDGSLGRPSNFFAAPAHGKYYQ